MESHDGKKNTTARSGLRIASGHLRPMVSRFRPAALILEELESAARQVNLDRLQVFFAEDKTAGAPPAKDNEEWPLKGY
jgi:hypothetical protein